MSSNFEFLREVKDFSPIHKAAVVAEVNHQVDPASCCLLCRRAAELAFLWLIKKQPDFEKEVFLKDEYDGRNDFNGYIMRSGFGESTKNRLHCIRKKGNDAAHSFDVRISKDDAKDALEDLHYFMSNVYIQRLDGRMQPAKFNADLIPGKKTTSVKLPPVSIQKNTFNELMTAVQFSESLGTISKDVREKIEKRVIHLRKTKKLDETASLMNDVANENIYVVNVDGYIGESTKREIEYAEKNRKEVLCYINPIK